MQAEFNHKELRDARKRKKISQMLLAELCESSDRYIRDLERGVKVNPSASMVCRISRALGISMEELIKIKFEEEDSE